MISREQVQHIAQLARLRLKEDEIAKYQKDLSNILDYFSILEKVDTKDIESMTHLVLHENVTREDVPIREHPDVIIRMMQLAPAIKDGFLKVKEVLKRKA